MKQVASLIIATLALSACGGNDEYVQDRKDYNPEVYAQDLMSCRGSYGNASETSAQLTSGDVEAVKTCLRNMGYYVVN